MHEATFAEYIWLDGSRPTQEIRAKTRIVQVPDEPAPEDFPSWSFDGSSTAQAGGGDSDCLLEPVRVTRDPVRGPGNHLVLCEVLDASGEPHESNHRARLRAALGALAGGVQPWVGFEQEYTLYRDGRPLGFPSNGFPGPQGPYYCSVGSDRAFGRDLVEAHAKACVDAGLMLYGLNAEVMPGQWEFQVGYRGADDEPGDVLVVSDHLWLARYLLSRLGERFGVEVSLANKPIKGDWNGAGLHTNFSTARIRDHATGIAAIESAVEALARRHDAHIPHYGDRLHERLTGHHETCDINAFRSGVADRGASIRIPRSVANGGGGYLEDRRPGANADPYRVATVLIDTICHADRLSRVA